MMDNPRRVLLRIRGRLDQRRGKVADRLCAACAVMTVSSARITTTDLRVVAQWP
jgi:hypothetical protein